jgi:hypothetical protein
MKILVSLILLLILAGCATENNPSHIIGTPRRSINVAYEEATEVYKAEESEPQQFAVLFREDANNTTRYAMFEPSEGAYLAAWLSPDAAIRRFEYNAGKKHAVYIAEMYLCGEIPLTWLLHCIASLSTPMLIIHPPIYPDDELPVEQIVDIAQRLGSFNLPMFITFFPEHDFPAAEFTTIFRIARNAFITHAPQIAFVWVAPSYTATPQTPFYPSHNIVDWVALPLMACWTAENGFTDVISQLEVFYNSFSNYKPIMILPLGVSHFTRGD